MNILVYATTFGADLLSTVRYLETKEDVRVKVMLDDPEDFKNEPIYKYRPIQSELIRKSLVRSWAGPKDFKADVTIMDNRVPLRKTSPKALMLWHGFGWKGPNDVEEFKWLHRELRKNWGDTMKPNPDFIWQCYGPHDFTHRTEVSGFHPENCRQLGAASHDELRQPIDKSKVQPFYPFDIINRPTLLIAPTWHYGEIFAHWGNDEQILRSLLDYADQKGINVILRFHDSYRFEKTYLKKLKTLVSGYSNALLKFKDDHPDNFLDLQVSDILMTNFSSIANLYYATGKPTLHIYPVKHEDEEFLWRTYTIAGIRKKKVGAVKYIWKFPPEDNGGLLAHSFEELMEQLEQAIRDPGCCREQSREYLNKHMLGADGKNRERIYQTLKDLVNR